MTPLWFTVALFVDKVGICGTDVEQAECAPIWEVGGGGIEAPYSEP